jgi:kynureninase
VSSAFFNRTRDRVRELMRPARGRLHGWWGHDKATRFAMPSSYTPLPGAAGWQFSNPSVLDVVALLASLQIFDAAAHVLPRELADGHVSPRGHVLGALREKSVDLTGYLEMLLRSSKYYRDLSSSEGADQTASTSASTAAAGVTFTIITPLDPDQRGCQLSLLFEPVESMDWIFDRMRSRGVLGDERRPGVIRFAPVPLYNTYSDALRAAQALDECLAAYESREVI